MIVGAVASSAVRKDDRAEPVSVGNSAVISDMYCTFPSEIKEERAEPVTVGNGAFSSEMKDERADPVMEGKAAVICDASSTFSSDMSDERAVPVREPDAALEIGVLLEEGGMELEEDARSGVGVTMLNVCPGLSVN